MLRRKVIAAALAVGLLATVSVASQQKKGLAQWKMVKKFVQPGVEVVEETKSFMLLKHSELDLLIVLAYNDPEREADIDIDRIKKVAVNR